MVKAVTFENFREETASGHCVLDFWASWCGPCRMMAPVLEGLAEKRPDISFLKVNVDDESDLANAFSISSIPTFVHMENGEVVASTMGYMSEEELIRELKI